MSASSTIRNHPLLYLALALMLLLFPAVADAVPIISGSPEIIMSPEDGQQCPTCIPFSALSFAVQTSTPGFVIVSTSGGGEANITAPQATLGQDSITFGGGGGGSITTIGPGTASVQFGGVVLYSVTNTGTTGGVLVDAVLIGENFGFHAVPSFGESLTYASFALTCP